MPENLESLVGFDPPPSPPASYTSPLPETGAPLLAAAACCWLPVPVAILGMPPPPPSEQLLTLIAPLPFLLPQATS